MPVTVSLPAIGRALLRHGDPSSHNSCAASPVSRVGVGCTRDDRTQLDQLGLGESKVMKRMRRTVAAAGLAVAGVAGTVAFAGTASAAPAATAAYNGACGAGYEVIDSGDLENLGTVYLTWSEAAGKNCVVTVRATTGTAVQMSAEIYQTDNPDIAAKDSGLYTSYAGPVYIPARGACITWKGSISTYSLEGEGHCGELR